MTSLKAHPVPAVAALAALTAIIVAASLGAQSGCASNCGSNCPPVTIYIGNLDGQQLMIDDIGVSGPACPPPEGVYCIGDGTGSTNCTHFTITGNAEGVCDVTIVFHDRPTMIVRTQFGPPVQQGCCRGYTIVGDSRVRDPGQPGRGHQGPRRRHRRGDDRRRRRRDRLAAPARARDRGYLKNNSRTPRLRRGAIRASNARARP